MQTADPLVRAKTFNIRFSEEEQARLDEVALHYALTAAGVIRMLIKREADAIAKDKTAAVIAAPAVAPSPPAPPSKPRKKR